MPCSGFAAPSLSYLHECANRGAWLISSRIINNRADNRSYGGWLIPFLGTKPCPFFLIILFVFPTMRFLPASLFAALVLSWSATAAGVSRATSSPQNQLLLSGCADDAGFSSCQKEANEHLDKCLQTAKANGNTKTEILSCGCTFYTENINCAATSCWNKVYECNYQIFVTGFLANCPVAKAPIPYFPIPAGAQDACSCNLGKIFLETSLAIQESATCSNNPKGGDASANVQIIQGCICCEISAALSRSVNLVQPQRRIVPSFTVVLT